MSWELWPAASTVADVAVGMEAGSQQQDRDICPPGNVLTTCLFVTSLGQACPPRRWGRPPMWAICHLADPLNETGGKKGAGKRKKHSIYVLTVLWLASSPSPGLTHGITLQNCSELSCTTGLERGNLSKGQQGNTSRQSVRLSYFSSSSSVFIYRSSLKSSTWGCLGGLAAQLWKGLHLSPSVGVAEAQVHCTAAGKGVLSSNCGNLHGNLHCNPLSPCHPEEALPKVERKQLKCLQPAWHPVPLARQRGGDRGCGFYCGGWRSFIPRWRGWVKSSSGCIARKPTIGNYLWLARNFSSSNKNNFFRWYNGSSLFKLDLYLSSLVEKRKFSITSVMN